MKYTFTQRYFKPIAVAYLLANKLILHRLVTTDCQILIQCRQANNCKYYARTATGLQISVKYIGYVS